MVVLGQAGFGALLVLGAGVIAALASVWLLAIGAAAVLEAGSGGRWRLLRLTGCPLPWRRRLLRFLVPLVAVPGLGVTAPLAATAAAGQEQPTSHPDGHADGRPVGSVSAVAAALTGLPLPDRQRGTPGAPPADHPREHWVEVRPGDTLWAIAARSLPAGADLGAVARRCRHIHRSNRAVIGDDPDLIRPGQRLRVPGRGAGAPPPHRHHEEES
ncbi:MAG TPA: LysM peptidoglycan-binding domain-containing protein [Marmoricola sp.]